MCDRTSHTKETGCIFPRYLYLEIKGQLGTGQCAKSIPNLDLEVVDGMAKKLGLTFVSEKEPESNVCFINSPELRDDYKSTFSPRDVLDYCYAVLQTPTYCQSMESQNFDFSHIPHPKDPDTFWKGVQLGGQLRQLYALESSKMEDFNTSFPKEGDNTITRKLTYTDRGYEPIDESKGKVWINDKQYFDKVPLLAWEFYVAGCQPAQKWLEDRRGRTLGDADIQHYQKIIIILTKVDQLLKETGKIELE
ncbi:hypothetical protein HPE56_19985 [Maribacter sp. ANRC-HE7]|uniref:Type ISP restriction-modification enzyme LLaBIII C-terminal specificity domain-containing protein n=1 Tax=Maribacter aquimaris TaxID=2737171 RepID=A0ABR7V6T2_9FLAO|nr:type ISP restriction/modification enzyme [Maribacter aquimaris]MBD0780085.1 hypothetical protein [Maribacter aquimaris]